MLTMQNYQQLKKAACVPPTILALSNTLPPSNAESDAEGISWSWVACFNKGKVNKKFQYDPYVVLCV